MIIGAGAAGVFTAYRLRTLHGDAYEIVLVERQDRVGGNALTMTRTIGGKQYTIDCGAQFFYKNPQPGYLRVLRDLGLLDTPRQIDARATGITVWDRQAADRLLWVPSHIDGFLRYTPQDWARMTAFAKFLVYALLLDRDPRDNWDLSLDDWIATLALIDAEFKDTVLRRFLYQFVTLPSNRLGEASARYAITYFARNVFGEPGNLATGPGLPTAPGAATFEVYQSRIGLDGVLTRALQAAGVVPRLHEPVAAVSRNADGTLQVTTSAETMPADHVVFATDPHAAASMLLAGGFPAPDLISALQQCEYDDLAIAMQDGESCWMPGDTRFWESVNTIVDGDALTFTAWFGPLRDTDSSGNTIPVFKSWASPDLDPASCAGTFFSHTHRILLPTTAFMAARSDVLAHQGHGGLWITGGWTNWFDSQEAALDSATDVVQRITGGPLSAPRLAADPARQCAHLQHWLARVAAHSPAEHRKKLLNVVEEVETAG
ncbi:MAG TPA: FAD-dependent oxidoreductase [Vicinamibacterales bacterium]|nr:FAD-dependent oxidoreductase [Vicinamibacterales bacterium]